MSEYQKNARNAKALFTLRVHRGDGMCLLAMNWKRTRPPTDFVGFAIEYKEPDGDRFYALKNRIAFPTAAGDTNPNRLSTRLSPIQKFRWVHFPRNAELAGEFTYRVTPVFMNDLDELSYGEPQVVEIALRRETYPNKLNVTFTRGFVSSQAFVDKYVLEGQTPTEAVRMLLPAKADAGLEFVPTHPRASAALEWMGFEARSAILEVLDEAIADPTAQVRAVLYDLNEPDVLSRLERLGQRLRIIIDDDGAHGEETSAESRAAARLAGTAAFVKRQHLGKLQHNKTIVVDGKRVQRCVCGSTNLSWRGFFVQNNNAIVLRGARAVQLFRAAYDHYEANDTAKAFGGTSSAMWNDLQLPGIDAQVSFSPKAREHSALEAIGKDIADQTTSSLFFSLAFLYQTPGAIQEAIAKLQEDDRVFCYGISDHAVKGLTKDGDPKGDALGVKLQKPSGRVTLIHPEALSKHLPQPFKAEPTGGGGTRLHHKFIVIDFDKPTARVYTGSYNFSKAADASNGENLLLIRDRRVAVSYVVEALRIFDHYHFRVAQADASKARTRLHLKRPPRKPGEHPWWSADYSDPRKVLDRELFA